MTLLRHDHRAVFLWLCLCAFLVASMVAIGGYTRLSGSGLSITAWKPIHGTLPPLSDAQWQEEFTAYQQSPQYQKVNKDMTLSEFKVIFWPEYIHRLLGRLIGAVFFLPLIIFALRHSFNARFGWRLAGIFALGGLQGLVGWLMVASGLIDNPQVSHLRLALHLSIALLIFALLIWAILDVVPAKAGTQIVKLDTGLRRYDGDKWYIVWFSLLCLQIILGAFMAGLHGGLIYNTWPSMNGQFIPDGLSVGPWYENITLIQFEHRNLAILAVFGFLFWWFYYRNYVRDKHLGKVCAAIAAIIGLQFALGVATLLHQAPLWLALAHQLTALLLFTAAVTLLHKVWND